MLGKRRIQYEDELANDSKNYDVWFDYARLEEGALRTLREEGDGDAADEEAAIARVREVYERAVAQVPPGDLKRHWRRYIFLWLDYSLFEEIETKVWYYTTFLTENELTVMAFRITTVPGKSTGQPSKSYHTNSSHLGNCG